MVIEDVIELREQEEILAVLRSHWITKSGAIFFALLLACVPLFFMVPLLQYGLWGAGIFGALITVAAAYAYRQWFLWHWNGFIVTTERVVDVDQRGFFKRTVSEAEFSKVQDVSFRVKGVRGTVFGYGSVTVQTAGSSLVIELSNAPDPRSAHHLITAAMMASRGTAPALGDAPTGASGSRSRRVSQLLDAAAELDPAEARAFLNVVNQTAKRPAPHTDTADADGDLAWFKNGKE